MTARLLVAGTSSGCGKTTTVLALLAAYRLQGLEVASFKCGPDYIDPLFHEQALGLPSYNLDPFFSDEEQLQSLLSTHGGTDLSLIEGVMGYYDGIGVEGRASTYDVAMATETPAVIVMDARGMGTSAAALLEGFTGFKERSGIQGVIFSNIEPGMYPFMEEVARRAGLKAYGCLPHRQETSLQSRHLGLVTAAEVDSLPEKIQALGELALEHVDLNGLLDLARSAAPLEVRDDVHDRALRSLARQVGQEGWESGRSHMHLRIAVARDTAFCFIYADNLQLLRRLGCDLVFFSPLDDAALPKDISGLYLCGGYPELYLERLSGNVSMRASIREQVEQGLPTVAECGGYMYLQDRIDGYDMVGAIVGESTRTDALQGFGYVTLHAEHDGLVAHAGDAIRAHEFHYWTSDVPGASFTARKAATGREYPCIVMTKTLFAGYPHVYLLSQPGFALNLVQGMHAYRSTKLAAAGDR